MIHVLGHRFPITLLKFLVSEEILNGELWEKVPFYKFCSQLQIFTENMFTIERGSTKYTKYISYT